MAAALAARSGGAGQRVAYRERVTHPALAAPLEARGTLARLSDGTLLREQAAPEAETMRIGADFITILRPDSPGSELLPVPDDMAPLIETLLAILSGRLSDLSGRAAARLETGPEGWRLALRFEGGGRIPALSLRGCGGRLTGIDIAEPGGATRAIRFEPAR